MKHIAMWLMSLLTTGVAASGQTPTTEGDFPLKQVQNMPENFFLTQLDNGLEVLVIEDHTVPLATIELVVRNGAFVQTPDLEGLAHLYEHMFFKANEVYPSQEAYLEKVNELGISFNGTTSEERVNYYITLNKSKLQDGLEFMNAAARSPLFLEEEMKKENVVVAGEFQRAESNPVFFLQQDMGRRLWSDEYSRKNTIGRYEVILNATPEIMKDIKNRYYHPDNSMLVIAGDVNHQETFQKVKDLYGSWKRSNMNIWQKYPIPDFKPLTYNQSFITVSPNAQVPIFLQSWHGPDTRNDRPATYAADVFFTILAQKNSKFREALVESGLAIDAGASYQTQKYIGPVSIFMVPNPETVQQAIAELQNQIAMWDDPGYFTDEQLAAAKEMLEVQELYNREATSDYVHTVTFWWASADLNYYTTYLQNLREVTRDDIQQFIKKYIADKASVQGLLISPQMDEMLNIGSFFRETKTEFEPFKVTGTTTIAFDSTAYDQMADAAYIAKLNPQKKLMVTLRAETDKIALAREAALRKEFIKLGVPAERLSIQSIVLKTKKYPEAERSKQDEVTFSLN